MTFEDFTTLVLKEIRDILPPDYDSAEIKLSETKKLNRTYPALIIRKEESSIAPAIDLSGYYDALEQGTDLGEILTEISEAAQLEPEGIEPEQFTDYGNARNHLYIRVSDCNTNKEYLKDVPHKEVCGLAVTCHVLVNMGGSSSGSVVVNQKMLEMYGVSFDQLYQEALENSQKLFPAQVRSMQSMILGMAGLDFGMEREVPQDFASQVKNLDLERDGMAVITNREGVNGAAVIFYPEVLKSIGDQINGNFFILPSSVHECIIVGDNGNLQVSFLENMVKEVNQEQVAPKDRLSDTVFHYDHMEHRFEKASEYADRMVERDQKDSGKDTGFSNIEKSCRDRDWER